jgi:hypothetical protein
VNYLVIFPTAARLPPAEQAGWWKAFTQGAIGIFAAFAGGTILFGIARGIAGGVLSSLTTTYGLTWLAAIVVAIGLAVWGARVMGPATERLASSAGSDVAANAAILTRNGRIELAGFAVIFTMMVAMRFGY